MKEIDASIILLTLNAGEKFRKVLKAVFNQTYNNFEVIIIDSSSIDNTLQYAKKYPIKIVKIPRSDFGHGKIRNLGAKLARGRYLVYLTQDAIPADNNWLANLLVNLKIENVAGVFGRQIPNITANPLDFFCIKEDFPEIRKIISIQNYKQNNVIFSDVNSAVKKSVILKYPYPENVLKSEDLGWAIDIIKKNYKLIYEPTAAVIHSHKFSLINTIKLNFDQGVSFSQIYQHGNSTYLMFNSKRRFINKIKYLIKNYKYHWILISFAIDTIKFLLITLGKNYQRLPVFLLKRLSNYPNYWEEYVK